MDDSSERTTEIETHAMGSSRRDFLRHTGCQVSALALCGGVLGLSGCTVPVRSFRARAGLSRVVIPVEQYPELDRPGGIVRVLVGPSRGVFVRHEDDDTYSALSAVCTHQGFPLDPAGGAFRCRGHGSVFDRAGNNVSGPARRPLARFFAKRDGDHVVLDLTVL